MSRIREHWLQTVEEFLRTTDNWNIDWIEGYYNILSKNKVFLFLIPQLFYYQHF